MSAKPATLNLTSLQAGRNVASPGVSPFEVELRAPGDLDNLLARPTAAFGAGDALSQALSDALSEAGAGFVRSGAENASDGRAAAGLDNNANNFSPPPRLLDSKWGKLEWLRRESVMKRQRLCMVIAHSDRVGVRQNHTSVSFAGLQTCGSRLCPCCGPRIAANNRADIIQAVRAWREGYGGTVLFGTFTVRHHKGQTFEELKAGVSAGWHRVTAGKGWVTDRRRHGVEHWLRVFEEKWSYKTGWHLHVHYLVFVSPDVEVSVPGALLASMFGRWRSAVVAAGLDAPAIQGQDLQQVTAENADQVLGAYFTKQAEATAGKSAESIGFELTNRDGKFSRGIAASVSLTPGEILTLAVAGDLQAQLLWSEYERGMKKRRVIAWSRGLRALVGIGDELSDEDASQLEGDELLTTVLEMRAYDWRKVASKPGRRIELLLRVHRDGAESAVRWLDEIGVPAVLGTFDSQGGDL